MTCAPAAAAPRRLSLMAVLATAALLSTGGAAHVAAQQPAVTTLLLPDSVAERVVTFHNLDSTTRLVGEARIGSSTTLRGGVAVLAGTLIVEGQVEGDVVVINGNLDVRPGGMVRGAVTVAGGEVRTAEGARIEGPVRTFREPLRYRQGPAGITYIPEAQEPGLSAGFDLPFGRTDMVLATHGPYNRVEGLPIAIGPRLRVGGAFPLTARAILIARTARASELEPRRIGYDLRIEQRVAPVLGVDVGARLFSEIAAIEDWGLSDREASLAAFVLHNDYRDWYERAGWSLYALLHKPGSPHTVSIAYRDEKHLSRSAANPLTLLDNGGPWRPQPVVAEGVLRSVRATSLYDTRNEHRDPSAGWQVRTSLERGFGRGADEPAASPGTAAGVPPPPNDFLSGYVDIRRYARLSPYTRIAVRLLAAGSLDGAPLPPQRQHALGGEGALPGYRLFEFDCGARAVSTVLRNETMHPYYGCDQLALVQLEYQANFPYARRLAEQAGIAGAFGSMIRWVAFFDAGRAWTETSARGDRLPGDDDFSANAGLGLRIGPAGVYVAHPLSGRGQGVNFFIRLGPRL
jgi:hypothetical protein